MSQDEPHVSVRPRGSEGRLLQQDDVTDTAVLLDIATLAGPLRLSDAYEGTGIIDEPGPAA